MAWNNSQQQIINYLYWLEDRGIRDLPPMRRTAPDLAKAPPVPPQTWHEGAPLPALVIVTDELQQEEERDMIHRIAHALDLKKSDYQILAGAPADVARNLSHIDKSTSLLALGPGGAMILASIGLQELTLNELTTGLQQVQTLLISHPRAMLAQPQLKVKAWNALQKFKAGFKI